MGKLKRLDHAVAIQQVLFLQPAPFKTSRAVTIQRALQSVWQLTLNGRENIVLLRYGGG